MNPQLMPGLPDDVARECLIRVGHRSFPAARSVCRLWRREIDSPNFRRRRKAAGLCQHLIAFAQAESAASSASATKSGRDPVLLRHRLALFDPATGSWSHLPPVRGLPSVLPYFCRIAAVGCELVVVGGLDPRTWTASDAVHVYNFATGSWRRGANMPGPRRSFFVCAGAADGEGPAVVLVAGGRDEKKNALRSAMLYDVGRDEWAVLPDMAMQRDECGGAFLRGRFHVVGGYTTEEQGRHSRTGEALDAATRRWMEVEDERQGGLCPRACAAVGGRMYMCGGGRWWQVEEGSGRRAVADAPADARVATQLVGWERGLMLMGLKGHGGAAAAGYVMKEGAREWTRVEIPEEYSGPVHAGCCIEI